MLSDLSSGTVMTNMMNDPKSIDGRSLALVMWGKDEAGKDEVYAFAGTIVAFDIQRAPAPADNQ